MHPRTVGRRLPALLAGVIAGGLAAIVMLLAMAASRRWLGISPPVESVPDRVAPLLDIDTFFSLFGKYGGYNGLKQFGILSGIRGVLGVGVGVGLLYALVIESSRSRRSRRWLWGASAPAWMFVAGAGLAAWIGLTLFLWPVLPANYRGLPSSLARLATIAALLAWITLFAITLVLTYRAITTRATPQTALTVDAPEQAVGTPIGRRAVVAGLAGSALMLPFSRLVHAMYVDATFFYDGKVNSGEDITPITPTERFYTVTKNVVDPDIDRDLWRLEIGGHVERGLTLTFDDLQGFAQVDQETTLMCISNRIGAGLFSNANWRGVRLRDVLNTAGVMPGAVEVLLHGADAYSDTFAIAKALEETTLLVYEMNGEPLPRIHGYPVRLIVPGLFGEKNIKWITRIDVVTEDAKGFYEQQGWGPGFVPPTRSDIFRPRTRLRGGTFRFTRDFPAGQAVELRGRAYAADRGIRSVEVSTDDGTTWHPAEIYYPGSRLTWSLWRYTWTPRETGEVVIASRAVDGNGDPQPTEVRGIVPQGASGYHTVIMTVT